MTTLLDQVPVERITTEARRVRFGPTLLLWVAAALYAVGWVAAKVLGAVWLALVWCAVAVKVGWQEARPAGNELTRAPELSER